MKPIKKKQDDRLLRHLPHIERQRQEQIRKLIDHDKLFKLS